MMNRPAYAHNVERAREVLAAIVAARPGITWGELAAEAAAEAGPGLGHPGALNGWLTNALKKVGGVADRWTFGAASPVLISIRDIGASVFNKKKVSDSLKDAGRGVFDDAFNRFLDALPWGIGRDFKTGYVVNRYATIGLIVGGGLLLLWLMRGRR